MEGNAKPSSKLKSSGLSTGSNLSQDNSVRKLKSSGSCKGSSQSKHATPKSISSASDIGSCQSQDDNTTPKLKSFSVSCSSASSKPETVSSSLDNVKASKMLCAIATEDTIMPKTSRQKRSKMMTPIIKRVKISNSVEVKTPSGRVMQPLKRDTSHSKPLTNSSIIVESNDGGSLSSLDLQRSHDNPEANRISKSKEGIHVSQNQDLDSSSDESDPIFEVSESILEMEDTFYDMTEEFLIAAFTILVYRINLHSKKAFTRGTCFGVDVPMFPNKIDMSDDYVKEVSKKAVHFLKQNILDGIVFHVMIEDKNEIPHVVYRYVFRAIGYFTSDDYETDPFKLQETLDKAKNLYAESLLELSKAENVIPLEDAVQWFSQWNISLGVKKEFITKVRSENFGPMAPFLDDDNLYYFPWVKRARPSQARKLGLILPPANKRPKNFYSEFFKKRKEDLKKAKGESKLEEWPYFTSSEDEDDASSNKKSKTKEEQSIVEDASSNKKAKTKEKQSIVDDVNSNKIDKTEEEQSIVGDIQIELKVVKEGKVKVKNKIKLATSEISSCSKRTPEDIPKIIDWNNLKGNPSGSYAGMNKRRAKFIFPLLSFMPGEGLVFAVYRIDYPCSNILSKRMIIESIARKIDPWLDEDEYQEGLDSVVPRDTRD